MTPQEAIAALDRQIARHGQDITLLRTVPNAPAIERPHRAFVRGYSANELLSGIQQGDSLLVISPTNMPAEFAGPANRLKVNDRIRISGRVRQVQLVDPIELGEMIVRLKVTVRG